MGENAVTVILETERLVLRQWTQEDAETLFALVSDPVVMRYVDDGRPWENIERVHGWIERLNRSYRTRGYSSWAVVEKGTNEAVGSCGFAPLSWSGEIDYGYLFRRDRWGRGYATEIGRAALAHGFGRYGFEQVIASVAPENGASRRVLEKLGFVYRSTEVIPGEEEVSDIFVVSNPSLTYAD